MGTLQSESSCVQGTGRSTIHSSRVEQIAFFGQDRHIRRISTLATLAGWTAEFGAHRAAFTVHAPARHLVSVTLFCLTLGLASRRFPAGSPSFPSRSLHAPGVQHFLPVWTDHPSFTAIGRCLLTLLRLGVAKSPFSTWLVLQDLAARLHRPRRRGISILNSRGQLFRANRDLADS